MSTQPQISAYMITRSRTRQGTTVTATVANTTKPVEVKPTTIVISDDDDDCVTVEPKRSTHIIIDDNDDELTVDADACIMCYNRTAVITALPCMDMVTCHPCSTQLNAREEHKLTCIKCRKPITERGYVTQDGFFVTIK